MMTAGNLQTGKTLTYLLQGLVQDDISERIEVTGISMDSRCLQPGDLFMACSGTQQHGARYISDAVKAGAVAVVVDADYELDLPRPKVPMIVVNDLSEKAGEIAHRFYDKPSESIAVIGITGTNGKTSTAWFIAQVLSSAKQSANSRTVGFIGTLGTGLIDNLKSGLNTTPDPVRVHKTLAEFRDRGCEYAVMEVSSHALDQHRIASVNFRSILFTNLSRDHLDYHDTMEHYRSSKKRLFSDYKYDFKIINLDDDFGVDLIQTSKDSNDLYVYTLNPDADFDSTHCVFAERQSNDKGFVELKLSTPWGEGKLTTNLLGDFNAWNLLASISALCLSGLALEDVCKRFSKVKSVPGRMEVFSSASQSVVVVDYAHTPDALTKALSSLREHCLGKLICVFGCGGDRDQGKRAQMGKAASQFADRIVLSNDNPRTEDPGKIIEDITAGIKNGTPIEVELDRKKAISKAISNAQINDIVLVAGKGHETTQQIGHEYFSFDDRQCVSECLQEKP